MRNRNGSFILDMVIFGGVVTMIIVTAIAFNITSISRLMNESAAYIDFTSKYLVFDALVARDLSRGPGTVSVEDGCFVINGSRYEYGDSEIVRYFEGNGTVFELDDIAVELEQQNQHTFLKVWIKHKSHEFERKYLIHPHAG